MRNINSSVLKKLLWASIEDYAMIWQLDWEFEINEKPSQNEIKEVLEYMLKTNLIRLYYTKGISDEPQLIDSNQTSTILEDPNIWKTKEWSETQICISATIEGEKLYYSELQTT